MQRLTRRNLIALLLARTVRGFALGAFRKAHLFDRLEHLRGTHVIKQDDIGAVFECVAQLVEIRYSISVHAARPLAGCAAWSTAATPPAIRI